MVARGVNDLGSRGVTRVRLQARVPRGGAWGEPRPRGVVIAAALRLPEGSPDLELRVRADRRRATEDPAEPRLITCGDPVARGG
jgi:hypothetical protein